MVIPNLHCFLAVISNAMAKLYSLYYVYFWVYWSTLMRCIMYIGANSLLLKTMKSNGDLEKN